MILTANKSTGTHLHQEGCPLTLDERFSKGWGPYRQLRPVDALLRNLIPCRCLPEDFIKVYEQARQALISLKEW